MSNKNIKGETVVNVGVQEAQPVLSVNKWKFIIWLFIITVVMLFASQTSAYLVRRAEGNWAEFTIPTIFWFSTLVLIVSSVSMHFSLIAAKSNNIGKLKIYVAITSFFGLVFLLMQYLGWQDLQNQGIYLKGNPSGSFFYIFTGLHMVHLALGLGILFATFIMAFRLKIDSENTILVEVCATAWHFLDILWLYLFVFLLYFR
ncbi:Cytochrome c oxidase subunit 3 [Emticicia aquatica]|jgi:cytochrome c oxidase subunit III|uniref:Cytochrome c oxidase subunit 3 n=1 Tax=Emticicia aquatica TaxID=1681835 RepID=A0ABM9ASN8_9BACT|nr:cytochrome c oxidase subunit 3 [Emticicia aquatica]CAH0997014.1 Cytochrome c oxidase subunit 3 [Emticicia aquatica]